MSNDPSLQTLWCQNSGMVNLYIDGQLAIEMPPALCEQLEKELAAARRVPERARLMAQPIIKLDADEEADLIAWGGVSDCAAGDPVASE